MSSNYYDVVVAGTDTGSLAAGALLARRGFRVLVTGNKDSSASYDCFGYKFIKKPFLMTAASSPAIMRIINELSLSQMYLRLQTPVNPSYQVILPDARISFFKDPVKTRTEIEREIPDLKNSVDLKLREIGRLSTEIEKLLNSDLVIPPESFFERREFARSMVQDPFANTGITDIFEILKIPSRLKTILKAPVNCNANHADHLSAAASVRLMGTWLFDTLQLKNGKDTLTKLFCDKIIAEGGDVQTQYDIDQIVTKRSKITGVRIASRQEIISTGILLSGQSPSELSQLIDPSQWTSRFKSHIEDAESICQTLGYSVNLGLKKSVIPVGMAQTVFIKAPDNLLGLNWIRLEQIEQSDPEKSAVNASCAISKQHINTIKTGSLRDTMLDIIRATIPFMDSYLEVIHSPFDKFGPIDLAGVSNQNLIAPAIPAPDKIPSWHIYQPKNESRLGIENNFHRTGIKGLILAGEQVVSGLGVEGAFIAAWGAAKIAGKSDSPKQRLSRSLKTKIEV